MKSKKNLKNNIVVSLGNFQNNRGHTVINGRIKNGILKTLYEYTFMSKVNGMYYFQKDVIHGFEKFIWSIIMLMILVLGCVLIVLLWSKYLDSPTIVTIAPPMSTMKIPYPAITICHPQNVIDYKARTFIEKVKIPRGISKESLLDSLPLIGGLTERQWVKPNPNTLIMLDEFLLMNNLTIYSALMELGVTCEDFILKCRWAGVAFTCFNDSNVLAWKTSTSHLGACCSFNYNPINLDNIPFTSNTFGIRGGLSVIGTGKPEIADGKSGVLFSAGFMLLIHHPQDFGTEDAPFALLQMATETFVDVYPIDSQCSPEVLSLPLNQRKCILSSDHPEMDGNIYRQPACTLECYRQAVYEKCKCHPYQLPLNKMTRLRYCTMVDITCIYDNYIDFKRLDCSYCLPSCSDTTFKVSTYFSTFEAHNYSINPIYKDVNLTEDEFIVHVYLTGQIASANRKIVVMSWVSLLANLGGVFNLCFGMSMLSLIEVFYYIFIRFRKNLAKKPKKLTKKQKLQLIRQN